jgi:hypothetical protein
VLKENCRELGTIDAADNDQARRSLLALLAGIRDRLGTGTTSSSTATPTAAATSASSLECREQVFFCEQI